MDLDQVLNLPSHNLDLLRGMEGKVIERMTNHTTCFPGSEDFLAIHSQHTPQLLFSLCGGPVQLVLRDYPVIWIGTQPSLMSVAVGIEQVEPRPNMVKRVEGVAEITLEELAIDTSDLTYCTDRIRGTIGKRIDRVTILTRDTKTAIFEEDGIKCYMTDQSHRPREVGIKLWLEDGEGLIFCQGLHRGGDDLEVIFPDMIWRPFHELLHEFNLSEVAPWHLP